VTGTPANDAPTIPAGRTLVGDAPRIRTLRDAIRKIGPSDSTVLVQGESGTGKELVARAIHEASARANGPLIAVNCAALVETLLLSELFGHEKGSFTGASARRRGRFELAEGGTLFLDEIGDISPRAQVSLLRVLQEKTFERIGGSTPIRADVRIVCATHRNLAAMVERGEFRSDLYYRLRGITLTVPALRERLEDLPVLCDHLLARAKEDTGSKKTLAPDALALLARYPWPGNVRELENTLRTASLFTDGSVITAASLRQHVDHLADHDADPADADADSDATASPASELGEAAPASIPPAFARQLEDEAYERVRGAKLSLPDMKRQIEYECIARALRETQGNITRAATLLGMKRARLSQLVHQYGLLDLSTEAS
jgi:sigma-54 specific flagellar transcriptional regulator A